MLITSHLILFHIVFARSVFSVLLRYRIVFAKVSFASSKSYLCLYHKMLKQKDEIIDSALQSEKPAKLKLCTAMASRSPGTYDNLITNLQLTLKLSM